MACTQSSYLELLNGMFDTLRLVVDEETFIPHPYVESEVDKAIAACEDACIIDGVFDWKNAMPGDTSTLRNAALSLLNALAAEGSTNAQEERESLVMALANGGCEMSGYSPDVRQYHKAKQAEAVRNARHAQQQRQAQRPATGFHYDRTRLPNAGKYYEAQGVKLTGGGEWKNASCPFHDDGKTSLRVRLDTGGFRCTVCGAHGGDVLSFHMQRNAVTFRAAAVYFGAWIGGAK